MLQVADTPIENKETVDPSARRILQQKIARSQSQTSPFTEIMVIGPSMAMAMLERNPADENRKLSQSRVALYAADMAAGRWQGLNGQTIVISRDGYLNDGQHRLSAVVATGGNIPFTVVFGVERETRLTLDQNKARTPGDYLGMSGITNANKVAAVANILYAYESGALRHIKGNAGQAFGVRNTAPTKALLHDYAVKRLDQIKHALRLVDSHLARSICVDSRLAAAYVIIENAAGETDATAFFERLVSGENLSRNNPILAARNRLMAERELRQNSPAKVIEIVARAWNSYRRGQPMTRLSLNGTFPKVER